MIGISLERMAVKTNVEHSKIQMFPNIPHISPVISADPLISFQLSVPKVLRWDSCAVFRSSANAEKLTENHICPTCKTISVPYQA